MKFCKDCRHCRRDLIFFWVWDFACCRAPQNREEEEVNLVSGKSGERLIDHCNVSREYNKYCGPEAKWFEAKKGR